MAGLQATYAQTNAARADFNRDDFQTLIAQKGRRVVIEQALQCPCKSKSANQQSNCKNCGGTGWTFINPVNTRLILKGMKSVPDLKAWSEVVTGDLSVTASDEEELCWMDRITSLDSNATFNEVLFFKSRVVANTTTVFAFSSYNIKKIKYLGYFAGVGTPLIKLTEGLDYIFYNNVVKLINPALVAVQGEVSVTIRYSHAPQYLMVDMQRESMESYVVGTEGEKPISLPVSGIARRQHYILGAPNLNGDNIIDNSYLGKVFVNTAVVFPFTLESAIIVNHNISKFVNIAVYDQNNQLMTVGIGYNVQRIDANSLSISFPQPQSGNIVAAGLKEGVLDNINTPTVRCGQKLPLSLNSNQINEPMTVPITMQQSVSIFHNFNRYVNVSVYDSNGQIMTPNVAYTAKYIDSNNISVTFNDAQTGTVVIS